MNKNLTQTLKFIVIILVLFWMMPNLKIDVIDNFFQKIIVPISVIIGVFIGKEKINTFFKKD